MADGALCSWCQLPVDGWGSCCNWCRRELRFIRFRIKSRNWFCRKLARDEVERFAREIEREGKEGT